MEIHPESPQPRKISQAVAALAAGELIAYPTDTVYGLGCDLLNKAAVERLQRLKNMPKDQYFSLICVDLSDIARYAVFDNPIYRTLRRILPGPYTCILNASREVPKTITPKRREVGIRIPDHPVPQALAKAFGRPLITTTAGPHGGDPLQWPEEIAEAFPALRFVLDCGPGGLVPTTVVDFTKGEPEIIREGAGPVDLFQ